MHGLLRILAFLILPAPALAECLRVNSPGQVVTGGSYQCVAIGQTATGAVLDGVRVQNAPIVGIEVYASGVTLKNVRVTGAVEHGLLIGCERWSPDGKECLKSPEGIRVTGGDYSGNGNAGIKVDACLDCVIENTRTRDNKWNGMVIARALRVLIHGNDIGPNGSEGSNSHGLYIGGPISALVIGNRVHGNSGYGICAWPAPEGTVDRPFRIEGNKAYRNGKGGILVGPGSRYVNVQGNSSFRNAGDAR